MTMLPDYLVGGGVHTVLLGFQAGLLDQDLRQQMGDGAELFLYERGYNFGNLVTFVGRSGEGEIDRAALADYVSAVVREWAGENKGSDIPEEYLTRVYNDVETSVTPPDLDEVEEESWRISDVVDDVTDQWKAAGRPLIYEREVVSEGKDYVVNIALQNGKWQASLALASRREVPLYVSSWAA